MDVAARLRWSLADRDASEGELRAGRSGYVPLTRGVSVAQLSRRLTAMLLGLAAGCALPSDQTGRLRLAFDASPDVYVGDTVQLSVHAVDPSRAGVIRLADLVFESGNPAVLDVTPAGLAVGKAADTATVTVRLRFADAPPALARVPVLATLRIDSIVPATGALYYGDTVTVFGVGLNPQSTTLFIGGLPLQLVHFAFVPGSPGGPSSLTVLVPQAASPARVTARRGQTSTTAGRTLEIAQHDALEPNDSAPHSLGVLNSVIRYPWLVLEGTAPGKAAARDWYTFDNPTQQDVTLVLKPAGVASVDELSLSFTNALDAGGSPLPQGWVESVAGNYCRGTVVGGFHGALDSQVVAVANLAPGTYHAMVGAAVPSTEPRGYELRIERGYHSVLPRDTATTFAYIGGFLRIQSARSGNCSWPDTTYWQTEGIHGATKTIDSPGAVAWYGLTVSSAVRSTPDIFDFGVIREAVGWLPDGVQDVLDLAGKLLFRSSGFFQGCLAPGSYLVAVSDPGGGTGRYYMNVHRELSVQPCQPPAVREGAR